jgi:signal transduction histidine kinase
LCTVGRLQPSGACERHLLFWRNLVTGAGYIDDGCEADEDRRGRHSAERRTLRMVTNATWSLWRRRSATIVVAMMVVGSVAAPLAAADTKAILVLHTYGYDSLFRIPFDGAFLRAVREAADLKIDVYIETIAANHFRGAAQAQWTRAYLRERYADTPIAVVAAVYDPALAFLLDARDPLFPAAPTVAVLTSEPQLWPERVSIIWSGATFGENAALALKLHPRARQIALVDAALRSASSDALYELARTQVEGAAPTTPLIELRNLPLDELLARVSALPAETPILVGRLLIGPRGAPIATGDALRELARVAPGPIYINNSDQYIGGGALGGIVISAEAEGTGLANLAVRIARDASLRVPPVKAVPVPIFDWRQLRRRGIDETRLPPGSIVRFRELSAWQQYRVYILTATIVLGLQSALITGLVIQRRRRRRTELALRENEAELRRSSQRNQDLAGRLITAQEAERSRIARDLHDDVSQQLAGVAIMLSRLKRSLLPPPQQVNGMLTTLQERTTSLADTIRHLSHELHPGVLKHAGLVAALKQHCAEAAKHHRLTVTFKATDTLDGIDADTALCLYRIAQEALSNVIKHAHARVAVVNLKRITDDVALDIIDDGVGFVPDGGVTGLGLRSMEERVRLGHGTIRVDSRPGHGTSLLVRMPLSPAHAATVRPGSINASHIGSL